MLKNINPYMKKICSCVGDISFGDEEQDANSLEEKRLFGLGSIFDPVAAAVKTVQGKVNTMCNRNLESQTTTNFCACRNRLLGR
ncbi:hypothetical protein [Salmonella sp. s51933]|uniref:hypothetical protein n=1 Tax=Salmonella sp. s51933 TaxID=3160127 RepID=UPI00375402F6